jgi:hypothetical protein
MAEHAAGRQRQRRYQRGHSQPWLSSAAPDTEEFCGFQGVRGPKLVIRAIKIAAVLI